MRAELEQAYKRLEEATARRDAASIAWCANPRDGLAEAEFYEAAGERRGAHFAVLRLIVKRARPSRLLRVLKRLLQLPVFKSFLSRFKRASSV